MSLFDATSPADTEAVKLGASRIRALKNTLNSLLSIIFNDDFSFKSNIIPGAALTNASVTETQLSASGATAGTYDFVTVNAQGRVTGGAQGLASVAVAALDIDWSLGNTYTKTITSSSLFTMSNTVEGKSIIFAITNGGGGSLNASSFSGVKWSGGSMPALSTGTNHIDLFSFVKVGGVIYGSAIQNYV